MTNKANKGPKAKPIDLPKDLSKELTDEEITKLKEAFKTAFTSTESPPILYGFAQVLTDDICDDFANAIHDGEVMSEDQAIFMGKMVNKILRSEQTGQAPDFSEFQANPIPEVIAAVDAQLANDDPTASLQARLNKISRLFAPNNTKVIPGNYGFVHLTTPLNDVAIYSPGVSSRHIFQDHQTHSNRIDSDSVEKAVRKLDAEIRNLDPLLRNELNFAVMEKIVRITSADEFRRYFSHHDENFEVLSEASRKTLGDLIAFYCYVKEFNTLLVSGKEYVRRNLKNSDGKAITDLLNQKSDDRQIPLYRQYTVGDRDYKRILVLQAALFAALPNTFADTVKAAILVSAKPKFDIEDELSNGDTLDASKQLRHSFIALAQNRGSFENFFSATYRLHQLLQRELDERMRVAHGLVHLYNSLGLDITEVIDKSRERILFDLPF